MPADAQHTIDSLNRANTILENEKLCLQANLVAKDSSLKHHDSIRIVYRTRYQTIREIAPADSAQCFDLLAQTRLACDTALSSADSVLKDCKEKDSLNVALFKKQEEQMNGLHALVSEKQKEVDKVEKEKAEEIEQERKKGNRKAIKTGFISTIAGFILGKLL